ncbi:hypothetical protein PIB30_073006 [Stylosanthes scabra]|uniref:Uncharacterized protein n=1 Tax=Stylosanthes scabra TaxID=79078 RepID=A0ABU6SPE2_9FABA|nr:hypothetical protein [Stylosanthes scabra]
MEDRTALHAGSSTAALDGGDVNNGASSGARSGRDLPRGWLCRASPIVAKPPPLLAAVLPWNRQSPDAESDDSGSVNWMAVPSSGRQHTIDDLLGGAAQRVEGQRLSLFWFKKQREGREGPSPGDFKH